MSRRVMPQTSIWATPCCMSRTSLAQLLLASGHLFGVLGAAVVLALALELGLDLGDPVAIVAQLLEHGLGIAQ